jgi:hypothetical protein
VASSSPVAPFTVAGSGREDTAMPAAAANEPLMNDLREIFSGIVLSPDSDGLVKSPKNEFLIPFL